MSFFLFNYRIRRSITRYLVSIPVIGIGLKISSLSCEFAPNKTVGKHKASGQAKRIANRINLRKDS